MKIKNDLPAKAVRILWLVFFLFAGVGAVTGQEYHSGDKAALKAFLTQPSQYPEKANWEQLLSGEQEPDWDNSEDWAKEAGVVWDSASPKRIVQINWENKKIAGSLNVSACTGLTSLFCYGNALASLTAAGLSRLTTIECFNNKLERLDLSDLSSLKRLVCNDNKLKALDVSGLPALTNLQCYNNLLEGIDLSSPVKLYLLDIRNNQLRSLDVRSLERLERLMCSHNRLELLNVFPLKTLYELNCSDNRLEEIEISESTKLDKLDCSNNRLKELVTAGWEYLTELVCSSNNLTSLDLSDSQYLARLNCSSNHLESLNIIKQYELLFLDCSNNKLTSIDLSENQKLEELYIFNNELPEIKLDGLKRIWKMHCYGNQLPLSTLPDAQGLVFYEYIYAPQQDIDGGATTSGIIDLQHQLRNNKTEFRWYAKNDLGTALTDILNENGIFRIPATYIGKTLVCRMTNADLPATTLYPFVFRIYVEGSAVGTDMIKESGAAVYRQAETLYVKLTRQDELRIYTPAGALYLSKTLSAGAHSFALPKGIWLVVLKEETFKVAL
ncbi:MAG: hypothetical protein LBU37_01595 [Tannerellaceae bacterium]|jgi:hypothetical protein|nr:hypothetical protein [Tannerellaceae bacterium]